MPDFLVVAQENRRASRQGLVTSSPNAPIMPSMIVPLEYERGLVEIVNGVWLSQLMAAFRVRGLLRWASGGLDLAMIFDAPWLSKHKLIIFNGVKTMLF